MVLVVYYSQPQKEYIEDVRAGLIDYKNHVLHFGPNKVLNKVNIMTTPVLRWHQGKSCELAYWMILGNNIAMAHCSKFKKKIT